MSNYYRSYSVPMKPEIEKANINVKNDALDSFAVPKILFTGCSFTDDEEFMFDWGIDSILLKRGEHIIKYSGITSFDVLLKVEGSEATWYNGHVAEILGASKDDVIDFRPTKEYTIEEYDLETSIKHRYKVTLERTSEMDEFDHCVFKKHFIEENDGEHIIIDK